MKIRFILSALMLGSVMNAKAVNPPQNTANQEQFEICLTQKVVAGIAGVVLSEMCVVKNVELIRENLEYRLLADCSAAFISIHVLRFFGADLNQEIRLNFQKIKETVQILTSFRTLINQKIKEAVQILTLLQALINSGKQIASID